MKNHVVLYMLNNSIPFISFQKITKANFGLTKLLQILSYFSWKWHRDGAFKLPIPEPKFSHLVVIETVFPLLFAGLEFLSFRESNVSTKFCTRRTWWKVVKLMFRLLQGKKCTPYAVFNSTKNSILVLHRKINSPVGVQ